MNIEQKHYTKLEIEIQKFVSKYGVDELIKWLNEYSKTISQSDYNSFHRIQKYTCEQYNIPIADINQMKDPTDPQFADAKKIITYLTYKTTKLQKKHLTILQGYTLRTIYNHIQDVEFRIKTPRAFKDFYENYEKILNKLELNVNS